MAVEAQLIAALIVISNAQLAVVRPKLVIAAAGFGDAFYSIHR